MKKLAIVLLLSATLAGCSTSDPIADNVSYMDTKVKDFNSKVIGKVTYYYVVIEKNGTEETFELGQAEYTSVVNIIQIIPKVDEKFEVKFDIIVNKDKKIKGISLSNKRQ